MIKKTDPDTIKSYLEDSSGLSGGYAETVFFPENEEEICEILKDAYSSKTPVTISGGGTGVTGGRVSFGGIVLTTDRLNKIIDIDSKNLFAIVQPGVPLGELNDILKSKSLIYPPDPTEKTAFLGGTVSTNASGAKGLRFGQTRRYVKSLRVILSNGRILGIDRGRIFAEKDILRIPIKDMELKLKLPSYKMPDIKNSAGYYIKKGMDLIDLFIGQEGTLAFISQICLNLETAPAGSLSFFSFFKDYSDALEFVNDARRNNATSLEFMDENSIHLLRRKFSNFPKDIKAAVFFEEDYNEKKETIFDKWAALLELHNASLEKTWAADSEKLEQAFKDLRHSLPEMVNEIVKKNGFPKVGTDIAVPQNHFQEMFDFYRQNLENLNIEYVIFGHIGESHLHVNMLPKNEKEFISSRQLYIEFVKKAVSLDGTVSAEHGIGKLKHRFLEIMYGKEAIQEMARVKKTLDPACILGRGNIFSEELLF